MWWCVTLSAQFKVWPHSFFKSCDGVWPSRLSPRSDLTLSKSCDGVCPSWLSPRSNLTLSQSTWRFVTLSAQSKVRPHPFPIHVKVRDSLGSIQGPTSPFPNHVMVCDLFGSVQGPTSPFLNNVMVYDPLGSVQGPISPFWIHVKVRDPLGSIQGLNLSSTKSHFSLRIPERNQCLYLYLIFTLIMWNFIKFSYYLVKLK